VFPHASLWVSHFLDAQGTYLVYTLLIGTRQPLSIAVVSLRDRLKAEPVWQALEAVRSDTPAGVPRFVSLRGNRIPALGR
jgi:hypothetical protein